MRAYVITTGIIFALVTVAHFARMVMEDARFAADPFYLALTAATAALAVWAGYLLRRAKP